MHTIFIERTASRKENGKSPESRTLHDWRNLDAYVLLAEPGAGKSEAFKREGSADDACYVTARNLLTLGPPVDWSCDKFLFIDALDERRSDASSTILSLDELRSKLNELGRPKFRVSCREADWFSGGLEDLADVTPNGDIHALWLDPLTPEETLKLLKSAGALRVPDPLQFMAMAKRHNISSMLTNPLLLLLLVDAVANSDWPGSRHETYELACRTMAAEHNRVRKASAPVLGPLTQAILDAAGRLCALLILSDKPALTTDPYNPGSGLIHVKEIDQAFMCDSKATLACLKTKLFISEAGNYYPRHRTIAEYLGASAIASSIANSLPVRRILTLMSGIDGRPAEPLRAFYAWLALHSLESRTSLVSRDPMALVLYGDVRPFSACEKQEVLRALYQQGLNFRWFRSENWSAQPFGSLGTQDMADVFRGWLTSTARDSAHQSVLECITDAIRYGDPELTLFTELLQIIRDASYDNYVRERALKALLGKSSCSATEILKQLLEDLHNGLVSDEDDQLTGELLTHLYPTNLNSPEVLRFLRPEQKRSFVGSYHMFWAVTFHDALAYADLPQAADVLVAKARTEIFADEEDGSEAQIDSNIERLALRLVDRAIRTEGLNVDADRLYRWLGVGVDKYGTFRAHGKEVERISKWLSEHPPQRRAAFEVGLRGVKPDKRDGQRHFHVVEERMFRSKRPCQWCRWLLDVASETNDEEIAKYCFQEAASVVISNFYEHDLRIEDIEKWVEDYLKRWPSANDWKQEKFAWDSNAYQRHEYQRAEKQRETEEAKRGKRKLIFAQHLPTLASGTAPPWVLDACAGAYLQRGTGVHGKTPLARVREILVVDEHAAQLAIDGLKKALMRPEVPSPEKVLEAFSTGERLQLSWPYSLAARLMCEETPSAWRSWSKPLQRALVAFQCADEDHEPAWLRELAIADPELVASVLLMFARPDIERATNPQLRALYALRSDDAPAALVAAVVPELWNLIPPKPREGQLRFFETVVLPASLRVLEEKRWRKLAEARLADPETGEELSISLHLVLARFDVVHHCQAVVVSCQRKAALIKALAEAVSNIGVGQIKAVGSVAAAMGKLVELLAEGSLPERPDQIFDVTSVDRRRESARALLRAIVLNTSASTLQELRRLRDVPKLSHWAVYLDSLIFEHVRLVNVETFRPATPSEVVRVLRNGPPSSSRDMAELARDHLIQLAHQIRYEESNLLNTFYRVFAPAKRANSKKLFANTGRRGSSQSLENVPRVENDCRDVVLALINQRLLQLGVQFGKEASYARETRADMQASAVSEGRRMVVPIEVKKDDHPAVWTAWREQLESRYMTNPDAQAIGMYVVLWFGHDTKLAPNGRRPRTAQEMASMLNTLIPADRMDHIVGLVIDLSR